MTDLRKDKRAPASLKVKYKSATVEQFMEQFGTDVSSGGIFVKTKTPLQTGALLKLELQLSDASPVIHGVGRVCWRREPGPDPNLPAGMGIKFIKLDPTSRTVVDRIVQGRGARPSRFDQTEGAEVAPPSIAPDAPDASPPPQRVPVAAPAVRPPGPMSPTAARPSPAVFPGKPVPAAKPAAPTPTQAKPAAASATSARGSSPGANAVAGLFADSPLTRATPDPGSPSPQRSSFFPPAPEPDTGQFASPAVPGRDQVPAPVAFGSVSRTGAAVRAEQARQSGEFLAAALAEGGVADEPETLPPPPPAPPAKGEDELIDQLFADVMQSPPRASRAPAAADPNSMDDVFAELSEEEGLSSSEQRISSPGAAAASRRSSRPARASQSERAATADDEGVDALFAELDAAPPRSPTRARPMQPAPDPRADEWDGPTNDLEETDFTNTSISPSSLPEPPSFSGAPPSLGLAASLPAPKRAPSPLVWIVPLLLVAAAGGGYFYYQGMRAQPEVTAEPLAPSPSGQSAAPAELPSAAGADQAPAGAANAAGAAALAAKPGAAAAAPGASVELEITALPRGAEVKIDGKVLGVAPLHAELPAGREVRVTVSNPGYVPMTKSVVPSAEAEALRFKLEPLPFELLVRTLPPDAELSVGGTTAIAPGPLVLGHLDGSVQVSVAKAGFQRMTRPVRLDEFREVDGVMRAEIEVRLSPLPGGASSETAPAPAPTPSRSRSSRRRSSGASAAPPAPELPPVLAPEAAPAEPAPAPAAPEAPAPAAPAAPAAPPEAATP